LIIECEEHSLLADIRPTKYAEIQVVTKR